LSTLGRAGFTATGPEQQKLLRRFFQKATALFRFSQTKTAPEGAV
jgi:hypothetical protein